MRHCWGVNSEHWSIQAHSNLSSRLPNPNRQTHTYKKKFVASPNLREELITVTQRVVHARINRTTTALSASWWCPTFYDNMVDYICQ